jgi:predicted lipid-binding transport protein (Tim44 family)
MERLRRWRRGTGDEVTEPTEPDPAATAPANPAPAAHAPTAEPWSPEAALRALSWWLGGMALGGMVFGMYGAQRPFGDGLIKHPLFIFSALGLVALLILRFAGDRPLVSDRALIAGVVVGAGAYLLGVWFGVALLPGR